MEEEEDVVAEEEVEVVVVVVEEVAAEDVEASVFQLVEAAVETRKYLLIKT